MGTRLHSKCFTNIEPYQRVTCPATSGGAQTVTFYRICKKLAGFAHLKHGSPAFFRKLEKGYNYNCRKIQYFFLFYSYKQYIKTHLVSQYFWQDQGQSMLYGDCLLTSCRIAAYCTKSESRISSLSFFLKPKRKSFRSKPSEELWSGRGEHWQLLYHLLPAE